MNKFFPLLAIIFILASCISKKVLRQSQMETAALRADSANLASQIAVLQQQVKEIIAKSIYSSKDLLTEPSHRISVSTLEPDGYRLLVNAWTSAHGFNDARFELQEKILNDLKQGGIKLPGMQ